MSLGNKRQRVSSPELPPPASPDHAAVAPPPSSITTLGHQFAHALLSSSRPRLFSMSSVDSLEPVARLSESDSKGSCTDHSKTPRRHDDDEIQTDEEESQFLETSATPSRSLLKRSSSSLDALEDTTNASVSIDPTSSESTIVDRYSVKKEDTDDAIMNETKPALKVSPAKKRTKEEIDALREAAMAKREAMKKAKAQTEVDDANSNPIAKELKRQAREAERLELAKKSLGAFGFTVKTEPGISRHGHGRGGEGIKPEPDTGATDAFGFPIIDLTTEPGEWKPSDSCSDEQKQVLEMVKAGGNVFFTGSAGVGKSFLLGEITRLLEYLNRQYQVAATTGIAALAVSGSTVHSWAGVGLGKDPLLTYFDRMKDQRADKDTKLRNWTGTQTLIIDEISMMDPELFTKLSLLGKLLRNNPRPFGGLQIIVCGDFFQLPPVPDKHPRCIRCGNESLAVIKAEFSALPPEERPEGTSASVILKCSTTIQRGERIEGCGLETRRRQFCFETESWGECNFQVMELTKVFRQTDPDFVRCLEKLRRGVCDEESVALLNSCGSALGKLLMIKPTNLYPLRSSTDTENHNEFQKLKADVYAFEASDEDHGPRGRQLRKERLKDVPGVEKLRLKAGAQVLLLANLDIKAGLVNGSRGAIVDWIRASEIPEESAHMDPKMRGKQGRGGFGGEEWREKAASEFNDLQSHDYFPMVHFACGVQRVIGPHTWIVDIDRHNAVARTQIPLALAWALTIHKSQGQSLDAVGVRMANVFEKGQAYVALSRCRTPAGMKVEGFRPGLIMAHETVKIFYERIAKKQMNFTDAKPTPVNPLDYLPAETLLLHRLNQVFGPPQASSPAETKAFAPTPAPAPQPAPPIPGPSRPPPAAGPFTHLPPATNSWESLLRSAAADFAATFPNVNAALFADQARQLAALALTGTAPVASAPATAPATLAPLFRRNSTASTDEGSTSAPGKKGKTRRPPKKRAGR